MLRPRTGCQKGFMQYGSGYGRERPHYRRAHTGQPELWRSRNSLTPERASEAM
jgi:hypothetical protein